MYLCMCVFVFFIFQIGTSNETSASVRDISAKYLNEFVKWSLRQADPEDLRSSSVNLEALISKICDYSINSSVHKQLGAALTFNNLYMIFRENDNIVDQFWIQLSTYFVQSLMVNKDHTNIQQLEETLNHLMRVLVEKSDLFNRDSGHRNIPQVLNGCLLKHYVTWLFKHCGFVENHCRRKCMEMFLKLAVLVDEINTAHMFIMQNTGNFVIKSVIEIGECSTNTNGLNSKPTLEHLKQTEFIFGDILKWMKNLYASLDFYVWLFENTLFTPTTLFSDLEESKILVTIQYFINNIVNIDPADLPAFLDASVGMNISIKDKEKFIEFKYNTFIMILTFVSKILFCDDADELITSFSWLNRLSNVVVNCLFCPQDLHFNVENNYIGQNYLIKLNEFIENLRQYKNDTYYHQIEGSIIEKLNECIHEYFNETEVNFNSVSLSVAKNNCLNAISSICKHSYVTRSKFWSSLANGQYITNIYNGLIEENTDTDTKIGIFPEHNVINYYGKILSVIFEHVDCKDLLIESVLNDVHIIGNITESKLAHGQHFYSIFGNQIIKYLMRFPIDAVKKTITNLDGASPIKRHIIVDFLIQIILYIYRNEKENEFLISNISETMLNHWNDIVQHVTESDAVDLVTYLGIIVPVSNVVGPINYLAEWCMKLLMNTTVSLDTKSKVLDVLPFITGPKDIENPELTQALKTFQSLHFPLESKEFREGSIERASYMSAFSALLNSLCKSQSPILLERIISIIAGM